jgi:hypothetical protein
MPSEEAAPIRRCSLCGKRKPKELFYPHRGYRDGYTRRCKTCNNRRAHRTRLRRVYGISEEEYRAAFKACKGRCQVCGRRERTLSRYGKIRRLAIDHDHKTGKFRGILCDRCNIILGKCDDDTRLLKKLILYLKSHGNS